MSMSDKGPGDDLLAGVSAISKFYYGARAGKREERRVYALCESGDIPAFKMRGIWHLRPSTARKDIERREKGAVSE